jgi:hypothetical protein
MMVKILGEMKEVRLQVVWEMQPLRREGGAQRRHGEDVFNKTSLSSCYGRLLH